jgi:hypothetical protein
MMLDRFNRTSTPVITGVMRLGPVPTGKMLGGARFLGPSHVDSSHRSFG